jgi:LmbE family N-acetylglucosaminyl deacetylase
MRVLAIAPHADDETLGCGGTLLKHRSAGDSINWAIVTRAHPPQWTPEQLQRKEAEIESVSVAYGFEKVFRLDFPTIKMDTVPLDDVISGLRDVIDEARPECIYLNHSGDVHSDHRVIFSAVASVVKPFYSARHHVRRLLSYEVLSSTDAAPPDRATSFVPNVFSDVSAFIDRKLEIMSLYESEVQPSPLPRANESIRALARYRGATIGVAYAEAFMLVREVG